ncbi:MAG: hypothetical protein QXT27_05020 [Pyrobaculum sp.]
MWSLCLKLYAPNENHKKRETQLRVLAEAIKRGDHSCVAAFFAKYRFVPVFHTTKEVAVDGNYIVVKLDEKNYVVINVVDKDALVSIVSA